MVIRVMLTQGSAGAYCACSFLFNVILFDLIYLCTVVGFIFLYIYNRFWEEGCCMVSCPISHLYANRNL